MDRRIFIGTAGWNVPARHAAAFPPDFCVLAASCGFAIEVVNSNL